MLSVTDFILFAYRPKVSLCSVFVPGGCCLGNYGDGIATNMEETGLRQANCQLVKHVCSVCFVTPAWLWGFLRISGTDFESKCTLMCSDTSF